MAFARHPLGMRSFSRWIPDESELPEKKFLTLTVALGRELLI
jgi:hypothetical protein